MRADELLIVNGLQKFEAESVRKPSGHIIVDGNVVADTLQCVHCNSHWIPIKGSGITRGYCTHCNGVTCGSKECMRCVPFEKKITQFENGLIKTLK